MSDTDNTAPFGGKGKKRETLSEEQLMAYFEGRLPAAQRHEVEEWLAEDGMESDALEGLHTLPLKETKAAVEKINRRLVKTLQDKKYGRRRLNTDQYTWIAIAIVLLLVVLAYIVIRKSASP